MLSCQQEQNVIDQKKRIVLNPSEAQKKEFEAVTFAEGEVLGIDILVMNENDIRWPDACHPRYRCPQPHRSTLTHRLQCPRAHGLRFGL